MVDLRYQVIQKSEAANEDPVDTLNTNDEKEFTDVAAFTNKTGEMVRSFL